jgi:hypothetical protein
MIFKNIFSRNFSSVLNLRMSCSKTYGIPQKVHFFPRYNENLSESIPWNFFGTEFRWLTYFRLYWTYVPKTLSDAYCPSLNLSRSGGENKRTSANVSILYQSKALCTEQQIRFFPYPKMQ